MNMCQDVYFSIIVPVYNSQDYIGECLESIFVQDYSNYQVIVVDDGSTDSSKDIVNSYLKKHLNILTLDKKHSNAGDARNEGLLYAEGDYCLFLDSDDVLEPDALGRVSECIEKNHPDIVVYGAFYFFGNDMGSKYSMDWMLDERIIGEYECITEKEADSIMYSYTGCNPWNKVIRKDFIDENQLRFQSINKSNDVYFIAMALALSKRTVFLRDKLINYRIHKKSIQGSDDGLGNEYYDALIELKKGLIKYGKYDSLKKEFCKMALLQCVDKVFAAKSESDMAAMMSDFATKEKRLGFFVLDRSDIENEDLLLKWDYIKSVVDYPRNCLLFKESLNTYQKNRNETLKNIVEEDGKLVEELKEANALMKEYKSWNLPKTGLIKGDRIVIYGAGDVGSDLYDKLIANENYTLAGWLDKDYKKRNEEGKCATPVDHISSIEFDKVIIAINSTSVVDSVIKVLLEDYNIPKDKIVRMR